MIPVVAENYIDYTTFMSSKHIPYSVYRRDYPYVADHHHIMGLKRYAPIMMVGRYYFHEDIQNINYWINAKGLMRVSFN